MFDQNTICQSYNRKIVKATAKVSFIKIRALI